MKAAVNVSVVIPSYNSSATIERAVKSVLNQTVLPIEIIIVDDCSTDIIYKQVLMALEQRYKDIILIRILSLKVNSGPATARNAGWDIACGKYVAFLDSDDAWHPQKLEIQYEYMCSHEEIFLSSHAITVLKGGKEDEFFKNRYLGNNLKTIEMNPKEMLFKHFSDGTPCIMLKNSKRYRFKEGKRYAEDYLLWLSVLFENKGVFIDCSLSAAYKDLYGTSGLSEDLWKLEKGELETFKILMNEGYINSIMYYFVCCFSLIKYIRRLFITRLRF